MKRMTSILASLVLLATSLGMAGCNVVAVQPADHHGYSYGPPPHAPAHGYRHRHHDHELVYDAHIGVYLVVGLVDYYFSDGHYYRRDHDYWHYSDRINGKWHKADKRKVPLGLYKKHHDNHDGKGRDHDH